MIPDPLSEILARWIFETFNVVEVVVIELIEKGGEGSLNVIKIHDPTRFRIYFAVDRQAYKEGVTVQSRAGVSLGNEWEPMCRFKTKVFVKFHGGYSSCSLKRGVYTSCGYLVT